jgi:type IX secretion system PorP/SprF family membrane protein
MAVILNEVEIPSCYDKLFIMKKVKRVVLVFFLISSCYASAQDPSFSQFFSSPLNINPALTGNINGDWRIISNFRDQWIGPASPYVTGTVSYDRKILQHKMTGVPENNIIGIGGMLMYDYAMSGIVRSTYASANLSYSLKLAEGTISTHRLTAGFGAIYGNRYVDFSRLDFEEQFTGYGFNTNLPTGEMALSNMKPYFSVSSGFTYSIKSERSNFDIGVAGFHLNNPKQTFLQNEQQRLPVRQVLHSNYERNLNDRVILNVNGIYQNQKRAKYFSVGGGFGYKLSEQQNIMLNGGVWYWSRNAIVPYFGVAYKDMQFGFSYDATISKLREVARKPNTFEFSLILRGVKDPSGIIACPWK